MTAATVLNCRQRFLATAQAWYEAGVESLTIPPRAPNIPPFPTHPFFFVPIGLTAFEFAPRHIFYG
ncbi:MAG: hypothetical protein DMG13_14305 [Acidobacteria bacterium]|nr:MAG: hypothetical protein DMG13_14305 [Acidobacteriota bacterium]